MLATFQNSGFVLSIGIFFSLMIAGLASSLPATLTRGLTAQGVPHALAHQVGQLPPVGSLFAAFLGYNPVHTLLAPSGVLAHLPPGHAATLTGKQFFPQLISQPFHDGLVIVFSMAMTVLVIAAGASLLRGGRYVHEEHPAEAFVWHFIYIAATAIWRVTMPMFYLVEVDFLENVCQYPEWIQARRARGPSRIRVMSAITQGERMVSTILSGLGGTVSTVLSAVGALVGALL